MLHTSHMIEYGHRFLSGAVECTEYDWAECKGLEWVQLFVSRLCPTWLGVRYGLLGVRSQI